MSDSSPADIHFLNELNEVIAGNLANEHFGVTELADAMNMSRSNLLRKVKKSTSLPVNQLIREARLKRAKELLQNSASNVSEVSHQVGFNSTSYFIKCFREYYGYPPGEEGKRGASDIPLPLAKRKNNRRTITFLGFTVATITLIAAAVLYYNKFSHQPLERSIVVLPFKNESNDSTNVYLINGLMESTLSNLQKIEDLKVLSRTSSEKYRNTVKSIPEMARELQVNYFIEGSGQKIGDQILLNIQLIEGPSDKHLWAKQYRRQAKDIFALQQEVAKNIAEEIEVIIGPEAKQHIEKIPTENLEAYDYFLKGKELFYQTTSESLPLALIAFRRAIELDPKFGQAYAHLVMAEYYLDMFMINKLYTDEIAVYADKAMLYDPNSGESLTAKALAYAHQKEYKSAVQYLEQALEYYPRSGLVLYFLTEFYSLFVPDPAKFLEYSLRSAKEERVTMDSSSLGFKYFQVSNAMMQAGFLDDGVHYIQRSLDYAPNGFFSRYVKVLFDYAKNNDLELTKNLLIKEFEKDTTRADIMKELAKVCTIGRDYKSAYYYYQKFITRKEQLNLEIYQEENLSISFVWAKMGKKKEAEEYRTQFKEFIDTDVSIYKHLLLALYYADGGDTKKALEEFALFSKEDNYQYWFLLIENDPMVDSLRNLPEFKRTMAYIKQKFWVKNAKIRDDLEAKGLYPFEEYLP